MADVVAEIGVLGGSALCALLEDARTVQVDTPYGAPSAPVVVGDVPGRFSTQGWSVVGMTGHPEAVLARELALCCTAVALVSDLDAGVEQGQSVTHAEVLRVSRDNTARLRALLLDVATALPASQGDCSCAHALDGLDTDPALP